MYITALHSAHQRGSHTCCKGPDSNYIRNRILLLSEKGQSEKTTYYKILTIWHSGKGKSMETVKILVVVRG